MTDELGFFIELLAITGPSKTPAELRFTDGLNVVSGASDTGKSYALGCIDYLFGASAPPSPIKAAAGYDTVTLSVVSRKTGEKYFLERGLTGGDVRCLRYSDSEVLLSDTFISARHSAGDPDTLSGVLLELSGLSGKQIRTNKAGKRRTLSFRDVAFLTLVDEERIIVKRPPHLSGQYMEKTSESEVFRLLATGQESGVVHSVSAAKQTPGSEVKLELIESMITEAEARFSAIGINREEVDSNLTTLGSRRSEALVEYEETRLQIVSLEANLAERMGALRQIRERREDVRGLTKRFTLLDQHYRADINRLRAIEESGKLLEALPSKPCPVCGAAPDVHQPDGHFLPEEVQASASAEAAKIEELRRDLEKVLAQLDDEDSDLAAHIVHEEKTLRETQAKIENELMPRVKESAATLKDQDLRRDLLIQAQGLLTQIENLKARAADFEKDLEQPNSSPAVVSNKPTTAEMDDFASAVQDLLEAWNYPEIGRVIFSEESQDLVISGQPRISHGKGVRALTFSAYILGLLRHCRLNHLPHPSLVLLDSPLVAYREADSESEAAEDGEAAEDEKLRSAGVKEAFYQSLATGASLGQVIIFENDDPPLGMKGSFTTIHFSKSSSGRYGLFPNK